jgi:SnoaL-like domain
MRQVCTLLSLVIVFISSALPIGYSRALAATDEEAVRSAVMRFSDAFNRHDAEGFAALFAPDADFVDLRANWYKGRQAILANTAFLHGTVPQDSAKVTTFPPKPTGH